MEGTLFRRWETTPTPAFSTILSRLSASVKGNHHLWSLSLGPLPIQKIPEANDLAPLLSRALVVGSTRCPRNIRHVSFSTPPPTPPSPGIKEHYTYIYICIKKKNKKKEEKKRETHTQVAGPKPGLVNGGFPLCGWKKLCCSPRFILFPPSPRALIHTLSCSTRLLFARLRRASPARPPARPVVSAVAQEEKLAVVVKANGTISGCSVHHPF